MLGQERDSSCGATRLDIIKMPAYARTTERARSASEGQFSSILPYRFPSPAALCHVV